MSRFSFAIRYGSLLIVIVVLVLVLRSDCRAQDRRSKGRTARLQQDGSSRLVKSARRDESAARSQIDTLRANRAGVIAFCNGKSTYSSRAAVRKALGSLAQSAVLKGRLADKVPPIDASEFTCVNEPMQIGLSTDNVATNLTPNFGGGTLAEFIEHLLVNRMGAIPGSGSQARLREMGDEIVRELDAEISSAEHRVDSCRREIRTLLTPPQRYASSCSATRHILIVVGPMSSQTIQGGGVYEIIGVRTLP